MIKDFLRTPFPWYASKADRFRSKIGCGRESQYKLITPNKRFLPFIVKTKEKITALTGLFVYDDKGQMISDQTYALSNSAMFSVYHIINEDKSFLQYSPIADIFHLVCGFYTAELVYNGDKRIYSEEFYAPRIFEETDYLCLQWSNSCDTLGILYQKGYVNKLYLESDIHKSNLEIEEEGFEDGAKNFYPSFQKFIQNIRIDELCPEFLVDSISLIQMHNTTSAAIRSTEFNDIRNVKASSQWEGNGCYALVEVVFQQEVSQYDKTGCCTNFSIDAPLTPICGLTISGLSAQVFGTLASLSFTQSGTGTVLKYQWRAPTMNSGSYTDIFSTAFAQNFALGSHTVFVRAVCVNGQAGVESQVTFVIS